MNHWQRDAQQLLEGSGVVLNGPNSWDPRVHDERFYRRILTQGTLGLGESYMDGWWDVDALDVLIDKVLRAGVERRLRFTWPLMVAGASAFARNLQSRGRAFQIGERHYDLGNDLYEAMLDSRMTYSCGYWKDAETLDAAQEAKLDLICRKLDLRPGQRLLDIGCGWGSLVGYAAENYGISAVGLTVSKEQAAYARRRYAHLPIDIRLQDYREIKESFDHIASVGMFEHVGVKNYKTFFDVCRRSLKPEGLLLLHTIGSLTTSQFTDPWISKYIFPNSLLPSMSQITDASEGLFVIEDWHNFSAYYDTTLLAWHENFTSHWEELKEHYDERFYRRWTYYLLICAGSFRARYNQLWQIVLSPHGVRGGYVSVR